MFPLGDDNSARTSPPVVTYVLIAANGSYIPMFPHARVRVLLYNRIVAMPAVAVLGCWIVLQIFSGAGAIFTTAQSKDTGGVAYMAHVGGFVAGFLLTFLLRDRSRRPLG